MAQERWRRTAAPILRSTPGGHSDAHRALLRPWRLRPLSSLSFGGTEHPVEFDMLCHRCHEREALVHLTQIVETHTTKLHLCKDCFSESMPALAKSVPGWSDRGQSAADESNKPETE